MAGVRALVRKFVNDAAHYSGEGNQVGSHISSANPDGTNGGSVLRRLSDPASIPNHTRIESIRITVTRIRKIAVTAASRRLLKICAAVAAVCGPFASASAA